jgi:hypothetical protein
VCIIGSFFVKQICLRVKQGRDGTKASKKDFESQLVNQIASACMRISREEDLTIYRRVSVQEWPFFKPFFFFLNRLLNATDFENSLRKLLGNFLRFFLLGD